MMIKNMTKIAIGCFFSCSQTDERHEQIFLADSAGACNDTYPGGIILVLACLLLLALLLQQGGQLHMSSGTPQDTDILAKFF